MTVPCPIDAAASAAPDSPALDAPGVEISYAELDRLVAGSAERLREEGLEEGDRLAAVVENRWEFVVLVFAAVRAGIVLCPLSTRLPAAACTRQAELVDAAAVVSDGPEPGRWHLSSLIRKGASGRRGYSGRTAPELPLDRPATVVFTSGSTGSARGVLHTFGHHYYSAAGSNENIVLEPGDRWVLSLPLYHVGGLAVLFRCVLAGATIVVPPPDAPLAQTVRNVTHASLVPTQLRRLVQAEPADIHPKNWREATDARGKRGRGPAAGRPRGDRSVKAILLGGGPIPPQLVDEAVQRGWPIHTSYGMTETASQVTATPPGATRDDLATSGRVLPYRELRVDAAGQIHVRGRTRFEGYVRRGGVDRPFDEDGWIATGDLGRIDDRGRLVVEGRSDNMFISGGENIQPETVESAIGAIESVVRVVVVPVDDAEYGRRPVAFVEVEGRSVEPDEVREAVHAQLPRFMSPDAVYPWPEDADTRGMKIDRRWFEARARRLRAGT